MEKLLGRSGAFEKTKRKWPRLLRFHFFPCWTATHLFADNRRVGVFPKRLSLPIFLKRESRLFIQIRPGTIGNLHFSK